MRISRQEALVRRLVIWLGYDPGPVPHYAAEASVGALRGADYDGLRRAATRLIIDHRLSHVEAQDGDVVRCPACYDPIAEGDVWVVVDGRMPVHARCTKALHFRPRRNTTSIR